MTENNKVEYKPEEKILILAGLFHDAGKFEQRCTDTRKRHQELSETFVKGFDEQFIKILNGSKESFNKLCTAIREHHNSSTTDDLTQYIRQADHLSSSQRVELEDAEDLKEKAPWSHKYLSSVFAKLNLNAVMNEDERKKMLRYYRQKPLIETNYNLLIPELEDVSNEAAYRYGTKDFKDFKDDLSAILNIYEQPEDFDTLIRLLMLYFEKYLWCVPDFTGSAETDISLYNHSKDVAAAAHALYLSEPKEGVRLLNLVIGDIPGIQGYIFDITNTKPAKVLRGRSVFAQVLTRVFASRFLEELGLSEVNVIMLAGGKFYILAPENKDFKVQFNRALEWCEEYMKENFNYELSFSAGFAQFDPEKLKKKDISFGDVVEQASHSLLEKRSSAWFGEFFGENNSFSPVENVKYIDETDAENIKCAITGKPLRNGRQQQHEEFNEEGKLRPAGFIDKQAGNELKLGGYVVYGASVIEYTSDFKEVKRVKEISDYTSSEDKVRRIIINPNYEDFKEYVSGQTDIIKGSYFLNVANYASKDDKGYVMDFETMEAKNEGAKLLTMIKGDIDNLGLLMATGLYNDEKDYTGFSRTTSLSYHLRYFFSTFFNNFLKEWDEQGSPERKVYTVFAGGDDLLFITPHGSSLELLAEINKKFTEFVCSNPEVHISYSLTNFKHNTPVRLVNEFAEENQAKSKNKKNDPELNDAECFTAEKNKASVVVHDTVVKLQELDQLMNLINEFKSGIEAPVTNNPITRGLLRDLLQIGEIIKEYEKTGNTSLLMWHPLLTYKINRNVKDRVGQYMNQSHKKIFEDLLSVDIYNEQLKAYRELLYAAISETIYKVRK